MSAALQYDVNPKDIRHHYDRLARLYQLFWGEHLHHGYFDCDCSPAQAQVRLMERLAEAADLPRGGKVIDVGCGLGGSAFWLADRFDCDVTGYTISPVQVRLASQKAKARGFSDRVRFEINDANQWSPSPESVDMIWVMESSEHFVDKPQFFLNCSRALKPGGVLAVCAWLRRDGTTLSSEAELVRQIAEAMMSASLGGLSDYKRWIEQAGLEVKVAEDITRCVAPTWQRCAELIEHPLLHWLINITSPATRRFVRAFPLMRQAYNSGAMAFGLFAAHKPCKRLETA